MKNHHKIDKFLKEAAPASPKSELAKQRYAEVRGRRGKEIELWNTWNDNGRRPEHLEPLLKSLDPYIKSETKKRIQRLGGTMPASALHQELRNAAVKGIESFKPGKGAQLTTHITNNFMRVTDVVSSMRNPKYNPRELVDRYGAYQNAVMEFKDVHGRDPSIDELRDLLPGWGPRVLRRMQKGFGPEVYSDMGTEIEHDATRPDVRQRIRNAANLLRSTMTPQQQQFVDLHYPAAGQQQSVSQIAKQLRLPEHKVYRIKKMVEAKISPLVRSE